MTDPDRILSEFIDAWNAARRPDAADYIERADPADRDALADDIVTFIEHAPEPAYSLADLDEMMADPLVREITDALEQERGLWPSLLPRLRRQARLERSELAARLAAGLGHPGREADAEVWVERMEEGRADPHRVSNKVLASLGDIYGVGRALLVGAADVRLFDEPAMAGMRLSGTTGAAPRPGEEELDEFDLLFCGGRGDDET